MAFKKYREKVKLVKKLTFDEIKSVQYRDIILYNSLKRMFIAMKTFCKNHRTARRFFYRVYSSADLRAKSVSFD